jgi:hypothetical protein
MEITNAQRDKMLHAVGGVLDGSGHRNYYCSGEPDPDWEALVEAGHVFRNDRGPELGGIYYHLLATGYDVLRAQAKRVQVDRVRWLRSNAEIYARRGGPSATIAEHMKACAREMEEMREVLREMARQKGRDEMSDDELGYADFEGAYEAFIEKARAVVGVQAGGNG